MAQIGFCARVSTDEQDAPRQIEEGRDYAKANYADPTMGVGRQTRSAGVDPTAGNRGPVETFVGPANPENPVVGSIGDAGLIHVEQQRLGESQVGGEPGESTLADGCCVPEFRECPHLSVAQYVIDPARRSGDVQAAA